MAEWKHHNTVVNVSVSTSGSVHSLCNVPQGDTDTSRDGDQLYMGKLTYFLQITQADNPQAVRVIFFQWFPQSTPAVTDVLDTAAGTGVMFNYFTDKAFQYKVLKDKIYYFNESVSGVAKTVTTNRRKIKPKRKKIQFLSAGTTGSNKLYALLLSDSSLTTHPSVYILSRLNFMDS